MIEWARIKYRQASRQEGHRPAQSPNFMRKEVIMENKIITEIQEYVDKLEQRAEAGRQAIELIRDMHLGEGDGGPRYPGDHGTNNFIEAGRNYMKKERRI